MKTVPSCRDCKFWRQLAFTAGACVYFSEEEPLRRCIAERDGSCGINAKHFKPKDQEVRA